MNIKQNVISSLTNLYDSYKEKGLEAIYLWGSITNNEFNEKSDVDSIGIVSEDSNIKEEELLVEIEKTGIPDFHIRLINEKDFKTGKPNPENIITTVMYPTVLLFDLPNWEHVAGKHFEILDFREEPIVVSDVINERVKRIQKDGWNNSENVKPQAIVYYLKELLRLVHLRQINRGINKPFSIKNIMENADEQEREIINIFKELKDKNYSYEDLIQYSTVLDSFVKNMIDTYKS